MFVQIICICCSDIKSLRMHSANCTVTTKYIFWFIVCLGATASAAPPPYSLPEYSPRQLPPPYKYERHWCQSTQTETFPVSKSCFYLLLFISWFLGDIDDIVLKRQKMSTQFLLRMTAPISLQNPVEIWLTSVIPIPPKILPQSCPSPCWFERLRHWMANCGRMVTDSAMVTMESL